MNKVFRYIYFTVLCVLLVTGISRQVFAACDVSEYAGKAYCEIDKGMPSFTANEKTKTYGFENYSRLDKLGRCGVAYVNVCKELMPTEKRGKIGNVRPSGWHTVKYNDLIDGNYLYNR